ncbi:MAG: hypothetical protein ACXVA9_01185 [Bdellovibrionales bacterium]
MVYKSKQTWKDLIDKKNHVGITRRDLLSRGLATGFLSLGLPRILMSSIAEAALTCPPVTRNPGAIAQLYAQGGPTMGARFIGDDQAGLMNATMAANYGITGTNLLRLGPNLNIDTTSPFGATLMQGPPGFAGGATGWQTTVLSKLSGGGHRGPFNLDDGAGANTGLIGGASPFKSSQMGKDVLIGVSNQMANWARGLPSSSISNNNLTSAGLGQLLTMTPNPSGLVTTQTMTDATNAALDLATALAPTFNNANRNGSATLTNNAGCSFYGNATLATPNFGNSLFTPANIPALTGVLTVGSLTTAEQAQLAAYYQSAAGVIGGVMLELGGRDYHGQSPQNVIAPADIEDARAIVLFLAACHAAQAKGSFLYFANGQAIASGVQSVTSNIGGTTVTVNAPVAKGDAGGAYNAGLIIFYDPAGSPPPATFSGTITSSGNAQMAAAVGSSANAVSGLYLSALKWVNGGTIPASALTAMNVTTPANIVVY